MVGPGTLFEYLAACLMRRVFGSAIAILLLLSGCGAEGLPLLEQRFNDLFSSGADFRELCDVARQGKSQAVINKNVHAFHQWSSRVALYCNAE